MRSLADALLTTDPLRRVRLGQSLLALGLLAAGVLTVHYDVAAGIASRDGVWIWTVVSAAGIVGAYLAIRSGWSERFADPALTVPQMLWGITCCIWAYTLVGEGRGGVFPIVIVVMMFGMFIATPRQLALIALYAIALFGVVMLVLSHTRPDAYPPLIEFSHFLTVVTVMPAVSILAARLARIRERSRRHRIELTAALARIRELATRDEITGLVNRRHLKELMDQEHQRCIRSGHTFCVAVFEVDALDALAQPLGARGRERLLASVAQEAQRYVRVADVLGCWDGDRFLLLMSDTRASLARGGLERLRERVAAAALVDGVRVTLSAGLAEHRAGETVAQTVGRAESALADVRESGRSRLAAA
jgi:diguanylate cyclase (GGDEF)-like protein